MGRHENERRYKVAIVGGGPAGLGAAIELSRLPFIDWKLYEKKPQISETGGGLSLQPHCWMLLEHNGAASNIKTTDFFRSADGVIEERRNGRSGELLIVRDSPKIVPFHRQTCRLARAKLQSALLKNVDQTHVHLSKKLTRVEHIPDNRVRITFADGDVDEVDLLIAADGTRSLIRNFCFPHNAPHYNGQTVYRTIVSKSEVEKIDGIPWAAVFWKNVSGLYVYTCPLGDDDFEVTARIRRSHHGQEPVSWGKPFDLHDLLHEYDDFCSPIRKILRLAAKGETQEFALCAGSRLDHVIAHDNIALIGDSSHPMLGNFGSGAGFALEDVYTLTKILDWAYRRCYKLAYALQLFDSIRSPYYQRLYKLLDEFTAIKAALRKENLPIDDDINERVQRIAGASREWMYHYEIDREVDEYLQRVDIKEDDYLIKPFA